MAEARYIVDELEEILTCGICLSIMRKPKVPKILPCFHTFCSKCLEDIIRHYHRLFCPMCRQESKIEIGNLQTSFHHIRILEIYETIKVNQQSDGQDLLECFSCSNHRTLVGYCFQCGGMICKDCYNGHTTIKALKEFHKATKLSELKKGSSTSYALLETFCKKQGHEKFSLEYYCQKCEKTACAICVMVTHYNHPIVFIEEEGQNRKLQLSTEKERLIKVLRMREKEHRLCHENRMRIESEVSEAKAKLGAITDELHSVLDEAAMLSELEKYYEDRILDNDEEKSIIETVMKQVSSLIDQCGAVEALDARGLMLKGHGKLAEVCQTTVKGTPILPTRPVKRYSTITFTHSPKVTEGSRLGKIEVSETDPSKCSIESLTNARCGFMNTFSIITRDIFGEECRTNTALIDVQIHDNDGSPVNSEITESEQGHYTVQYQAKKPSPCKIAVEIGGTPVSNSPQESETTDSEAEMVPIRIFQSPALEPVLLAVSEERGLIAVVNEEDDDHRVVLCTTTGDLIAEFGHEGEEQDLLKDPRGVLFNNKQILIIDNEDHHSLLKLYDVNGKLTMSPFYQKGMMFSGLCATTRVIACLTRDVECRQTLIQLFDKKTYELLENIKLLGISNNWIPWSIAYSNNMYFVTFFNISSVFVFDEKGKLLYRFGEKGRNAGQLDHPFGLAPYGDNMLLVCDGSNHRLQLFRQDGRFIWSLGSYGKCDFGQMKVPIDVAVTTDGRAVLLELIGRRLQVFE